MLCNQQVSLTDREIVYLLNQYGNRLHETRINYWKLWKNLDVEAPEDFVDPEQTFDRLPEPYGFVYDEVVRIVSLATKNAIVAETNPSLARFRKQNATNLSVLQPIQFDEIFEIPRLKLSENNFQSMQTKQASPRSLDSTETPEYAGTVAAGLLGTDPRLEFLNSLFFSAKYMRTCFGGKGKSGTPKIDAVTQTSTMRGGKLSIVGGQDGLIHIFNPRDDDRHCPLLSFRAFTPRAPVVDPSKWSAVSGSICWEENPETSGFEYPSDSDEDEEEDQGQTTRWIFCGDGGLVESLCKQCLTHESALSTHEQKIESMKENISQLLESGSAPETSKDRRRPKSGGSIKSSRSSTRDDREIDDIEKQCKTLLRMLGETIDGFSPSFVYPPSDVSSFGMYGEAVDEDQLQQERQKLLHYSCEENFEPAVKSKLKELFDTGKDPPAKGKPKDAKSKPKEDSADTEGKVSMKKHLQNCCETSKFASNEDNLASLQSANFVVSSALPISLTYSGVSKLPQECPAPSDDFFEDAELLRGLGNIDTQDERSANSLREAAARAQTLWAQSTTERGVLIAVASNLNSFEQLGSDRSRFRPVPAACEIRWFHVEEKALQSRSARLNDFEVCGDSGMENGESSSAKMGFDSMFGEGEAFVDRLHVAANVSVHTSTNADEAHMHMSFHDVFANSSEYGVVGTENSVDPEAVSRLAAVPSPGMPPNTILSPVRWVAFSRIPAPVGKISMSPDGRFTSVTTGAEYNGENPGGALQFCNGAYVFHHHPSVFAPRPTDPSASSSDQPKVFKPKVETDAEVESDEELEDNADGKHSFDEALVPDEAGMEEDGAFSAKKRNCVGVPSPLRPIPLAPLYYVPSPAIGELLEGNDPTSSFDLSSTPFVAKLEEWESLIRSNWETCKTYVHTFINILLKSKLPVVPVEYLEGNPPAIDFVMKHLSSPSDNTTSKEKSYMSKSALRRMSVTSSSTGATSSRESMSSRHSGTRTVNPTSLNTNLDYELLKSSSPTAGVLCVGLLYNWPYDRNSKVFRGYGPYRNSSNNVFLTMFPSEIVFPNASQSLPFSESDNISAVSAREWAKMRFGRVDGMRSPEVVDHFSFYSKCIGNTRDERLRPSGPGDNWFMSVSNFRLARPHAVAMVQSAVTVRVLDNPTNISNPSATLSGVDDGLVTRRKPLGTDKGLSLQRAVIETSMKNRTDSPPPSVCASALCERIRNKSLSDKALLVIGCQDGSITVIDVDPPEIREFREYKGKYAYLPPIGSVLEVIHSGASFGSSNRSTQHFPIKHLKVSNGRWLCVGTEQNNMLYFYDLTGCHYPVSHYRHEKLVSFEACLPLPGESLGSHLNVLRHGSKQTPSWGAIDGICTERYLYEESENAGYLVSARNDGFQDIRRMLILDRHFSRADPVTMLYPILVLEVQELPFAGSVATPAFYFYDVCAGQLMGRIDGNTLQHSLRLPTEEGLDFAYNSAYVAADAFIVPGLIPESRGESLPHSKYSSEKNKKQALIDSLRETESKTFGVTFGMATLADIILKCFPSVKRSTEELGTTTLDKKAAALQLFQISTPLQRFSHPDVLYNSSKERIDLFSLEVNKVQNRLGSALCKTLGLSREEKYPEYFARRLSPASSSTKGHSYIRDSSSPPSSKVGFSVQQGIDAKSERVSRIQSSLMKQRSGKTRAQSESLEQTMDRELTFDVPIRSNTLHSESKEYSKREMLGSRTSALADAFSVARLQSRQYRSNRVNSRRQAIKAKLGKN